MIDQDNDVEDRKIIFALRLCGELYDVIYYMKYILLVGGF